jgi:hypothetical protein
MASISIGQPFAGAVFVFLSILLKQEKSSARETKSSIIKSYSKVREMQKRNTRKKHFPGNKAVTNFDF